MLGFFTESRQDSINFYTTLCLLVLGELLHLLLGEFRSLCFCLPSYQGMLPLARLDQPRQKDRVG